MNQTAFFILLVWLLTLTSCNRANKTEPEDKQYWTHRFTDSAYRLLYKTEDTTAALRFFDSSLRHENEVTVYPKAIRFDLLANHSYFFTKDDHATAAWIDSALSLYHNEELQHRYPRMYVGYLLFGGQIAYRLAQYNKANNYFFKAKNLAEAYLSPCEQKDFYYNIAMVLYRQQNFSKSLAYFREAFNLQETCSPYTTAVILQQQEIQSNIGLCFIKLKSHDSAMAHFRAALQLADRFKDSPGTASMDMIYGVVYGNMAQVALAERKLVETEQLALKSIALNDRPEQDKVNALTVKLQLAEVYRQKKAPAEMKKVLQGCDTGLLQANATQNLEWYRLMASFYQDIAVPDSALHFYKHYFSLKEAVSDKQTALTAADVVRQLKDKERELQIEVLKHDQRNTLISLWVTITLSCMAMVMIFLVYQNYRRSKKSLAISLALNQEIQRQKKAREEEVQKRHKLITEAVIKAQESERSLIGLELHDNINQVLTTVKLHNEMLLEGHGDPTVILPRTLGYLQYCIDEIRGLSRQLSAPTLGKISLEESLKDLIASVNLASKVKITMEINNVESEELKKEIHIRLYRILQEQLNNVLKHADASEIVVRLKRDDGMLCLSVADNGKGFIVSGDKNGIGLLNMQTRAENLNGTFVVHSLPGKGCQMSVEVPCLQ